MAFSFPDHFRFADSHEYAFADDALVRIGISEFAAIISPPQSSILAIGKIIKKPVVVDNEVTIGNTLKSTLSADHRVLDGAVAGKLLKDFNDIIEDPFEIWIKSNDMEIL